MRVISGRQFDVLFDQVFGSRLVKSAFVANLFTKLDDALKATTRLRSADRIARVTEMSGITAENLIEAIGKNPDEFLRIYGRIKNRSDSVLKRVIDAAWSLSGRTQSIEEFASAASKAGGGRQLSLLPAAGETGLVRGTNQLIEGASDEAANAIIAAAKKGLTAQDFERLHRAYFSAGANKREIISALNNAFYREPGLRDIFLDFMKRNKASASFFGDILADVRGVPIYEANIRQIANGIISAVENGSENAPEAQRLITQLEQQIGTNPTEVSRTLESLSDDQARILGEYYRRTRGYGIPEAIRRSEQRLGIIDVGEDAVRGADDIKPISFRPPTVETPTVTRQPTIETPTGVRPATGELPPVVRPGSEGSSVRVPGGLPSAGSALPPITEVDDLATIISKIEQRSGDLTDKEAIIILNMMEQNGEVFAAKLLTEKSGKFRVFLADYDKNVNLRAILLEAEDIIRRSPNAVATIIRDAPAASAAARQRNWGKAARIGAGIAAGLVGAALISFIMGDDDEEVVPPQSAATTSGGGSSGSPQGRGEPTTDLTDRYREASKIMMDKGYLSGIQTSWTKEFDAGFRPFIDAGTKNNKALRGTNLVGGQTWVQAAPTIAFPPTEKGALDAVTILGKFVPAIGEKGTGEAREEVPQVGPGDTRQSSKEDVLADIISRLYNNRLVEGGGGIFSNELKQTQTLVNAVGGGTPTGYRNAAKVILTRNPSLSGILPESPIGDVLTKKNIRRHPAYMAAKETQKTIHQIFEAANDFNDKGLPNLINPGRKGSTENIKTYLASSAGGSWKLASERSTGNMSKNAISKRSNMISARLVKEADMRDNLVGFGAGVGGLGGAVGGGVAGTALGLPVSGTIAGGLAGGVAGGAAGGALGGYLYDYFAGGEIDKAYPELKNKRELELIYMFKKDLDNVWFNSDKSGVLLFDAIAYFLGFNYGYDIKKLEDKLVEVGLNLDGETFEELMNDDESGSYDSVKRKLDQGRADKQSAGSATSAKDGGSAASQATRGEVSYSDASQVQIMSKIMIEKGYLSSPQSSWTQEFDRAFREFVDAGTKASGEHGDTNMVDGESWVNVAERAGFAGSPRGALSAVVALKEFVPRKTARDLSKRFVKLAESRKARIKVEVLGNLTPAEKAVIRRNKMREI
jgi:hypothetical protein